jgi:alpha-N-acetylglucosaminidase
MWEKTDGFQGAQWVWTMLHNFGGRSDLYGRIPQVGFCLDAPPSSPPLPHAVHVNLFPKQTKVAHGPTQALRASHIAAKRGEMGPMVGIGLAMEGMDSNIVLYDLMLEHVWEDSVSSPSSILDDTTAWLNEWSRRRYSFDSLYGDMKDRTHRESEAAMSKVQMALSILADSVWACGTKQMGVRGNIIAAV